MYIWVHPWLAQDVCELLNVSSIAGTEYQEFLLTLSLEEIHYDSITVNLEDFVAKIFL